MEKENKIKLIALQILEDCVSDYAIRILDEIAENIINDVEECADATEWNDDDVRLAIGRAIIDKMK